MLIKMQQRLNFGLISHTLTLLFGDLNLLQDFSRYLRLFQDLVLSTLNTAFQTWWSQLTYTPHIYSMSMLWPQVDGKRGLNLQHLLSMDSPFSATNSAMEPMLCTTCLKTQSMPTTSSTPPSSIYWTGSITILASTRMTTTTTMTTITESQRKTVSRSQTEYSSSDSNIVIPFKEKFSFISISFHISQNSNSLLITFIKKYLSSHQSF